MAADSTTELERTLSDAVRSATGSLSLNDRDVLLASNVSEADLDTDATNHLIHTRANNLMQLTAVSITVAQPPVACIDQSSESAAPSPTARSTR